MAPIRGGDAQGPGEEGAVQVPRNDVGEEVPESAIDADNSSGLMRCLWYSPR